MMLTTIELKEIRTKSLATAKLLGYAANNMLPLLESESPLRSVTELRERMLCLDAVLWRAAGLSEAQSTAWLTSEGLLSALSATEARYLKEPDTEPFMSGRAESLLALAWCAGLIDGLDFSVECPKTLVNLFPSVPKGEHASTFGSDLAMREKRLIVAQCDLAYCLHWSIRDAQLNGRVLLGKLHPVYVVERRRALEWMLSTQDWDDVSLDT